MVKDPRFTRFFIKEYNFWDLYLNENQRLLGRCYAWLKRPGFKQSLALDVSKVERDELFDTVIGDWQAVMQVLLNPSLYNYCWLGNEIWNHGGHGHLHMIPRYELPFQHFGEQFDDALWGHNYDHAGDKKLPKRELSSEQNEQLIGIIRGLL